MKTVEITYRCHADSVAVRARPAVLDAALTSCVQHALHEDGAAPGLRASYGADVIATRRIWAPRTGCGDRDGLASPAANAAGFLDLGDAMVASPRIRALVASSGAPGGHAR